MLSRISCPLNEAALVFRNNGWQNFLNLVGYDFSNQFVTSMQREIGGNLLKLIAPFSFGISAKKVEFVPPLNLEQVWDFLTILSRSCLMILQHAL